MNYVIAWAIAFVCGAWVYDDAKKRDWSGDRFADKPWKWFLGVVLLWIIVFPVYLIRRGKRPLVVRRGGA